MDQLDTQEGGQVESCTENSNLIESLDSLLQEKNYENALNIVKQRGREEFYEKGLDLIPVVCKYLDDTEDSDKLEARSGCEEILNDVSKYGNAKEVLIGLLEQIDNQQDDFKFITLLTPIQTVLKRLPSKRGKSLEWVMTELYGHVSALPLPNTSNFEEKERKLLDLQPETQRISDVMKSLIHFYKPFVEELAITVDCDETKIDFQRQKMTYFLFQLLGRPIVHMDLSHKSGDAKNTLHVVSEKILHNIKLLQSNFFKLFTFNAQLEQFEKLDPGDKLSDLSIANFYYLVLAEEIEYAHCPSVYSHIYLVESCLPFTNALLKRTEESITHKGILLTSFLLKRIEEKELEVTKLDFTQYIVLAQNLISVMLYSNVQEFRLEAVSLLRQYINKFDLIGRYQLIKCLLESNEHSGVQGLLIQSFKNNLNEALAMQPVSPYYIGSNLNSVMSIVTRLGKGVETDVLEHSDRLLGALNLIRYLALRDQAQVNVTGFWSFVKDVERDFLVTLRQCLDFSRAHYQFELKCQKEEGENVSSEKMLPIHSQKVLKLALSTFDMIESITGRIEELISVGKNSYVVWTKTVSPVQVKLYQSSSKRFLSEKDENSQLTAQAFNSNSAEDDVKESILNAALEFVPQYGWSKEALAAGAEVVGLSRAAQGLLPNGEGDLVLFFYARCNSELEAQLERDQTEQPLKSSKRAFVINAIRNRLMMINPFRTQWPQAMAILSSPPNIVPAFQNLTDLVDTVWYYAGDRSVDFNWYTKRASLAAVYKTTELFFLQDDSPDFKETWVFLENRVQNIESLGKFSKQMGNSGTVIKGLFTTVLNTIGIQNTNR